MMHWYRALILHAGVEFGKLVVVLANEWQITLDFYCI